MSPVHLLLFTFLPFAYRILHANGYRGFLRRKKKKEGGLPSQRRKGVGGAEESGVWPMTSTVAKVRQKKEQETSGEKEKQ
jgi:hypothetical protein